ncbi:MAG: hypothetical protein KAU46_00995, partial [Candidatus Aminicenantes bacterium]|nr:hypothetical protein [Candidatus Aminicenantes bacterium]
KEKWLTFHNHKWLTFKRPLTHVAGSAALVWGDRSNLDWWQVKTIIMKGVDTLGDLDNKVRTEGRLNAYNALTESTPDLPDAPSNLYGEGYCWEVELTWNDNSDNEDGFIIYRKSGNAFWEVDRVGSNVTTFWDDVPCGELWVYYVRAYNEDGNSIKTLYESVYTTPCYYCDDWEMKIIPDKKIINPGESVTYTYEVKNKGKMDLTDIELIDDKLGKIATKFNLKKGETKTFTKTVIWTETTTNCVTAKVKYHYENKTMNFKAHATVKVRK